MCHTTNPLITQSLDLHEPSSSGFIELKEAASTENFSQSKSRTNRIRSVTSFFTYGVFAAALLGLITIVSSNTLQVAQALSVDNQDLHGQGLSPENLLKARRILAEDPLMRDFSRCKECVQYPHLKLILERSARAAESEVMLKVSEATKIHLDGAEDEKIVTMENFVEKTKRIPELQGKLQELLNLNKTFEVSLKRAIEHERTVQDLRYRYEVKARNIDDLSRKAIKSLQDSGDLSRRSERFKKQLQDADEEYNRRTNTLKADKTLIQNKIDRMAGELKNNLEEAGVASAPMLSDTIAFKASLIDAQKKVVESCEERIETHTEEITHLNIRHTSAHRSLGDIELQLSQWHWVKHVLETIKKFEDIRDQIKELQKTQLADGKTNVDRLIRSLTNNEAEFAFAKWNLVEGKGTGNVEKRTVTNEYGHTVVTETVTNAGPSNLENQQAYIEQEQRYLKTWSREQFKTLNLSTHEIRNLTETIDNLYERVKNAGEYNKYTDLKTLTEKEIEVVITRIGELEKEMDACKNIINEHSKTIDDAQREISKLEKLRSAIRDLESQMAAEEAKLQAKDTALRRAKQELMNNKNTLVDDISQLDKKLRDFREQLKALVKTINEKIMDHPRLDVVNKAIAGYRTHVRTSNEEYQRLVDLMDEIKRIIC